MICLIPSYEPDERLLMLIEQLTAMDDMSVVIVDDGSGEGYAPMFQLAREAGCVVLTHAVNRGKGRALKTGFRFLKEIGTSGSIVCADSDGQHLPADIRRIADTISAYPGQIVLGSRHFTGEVPLRSRFGNAVTRKVFAFTTGTAIQDTQTGLRGYSVSMLDWLCEVPGDRFEYEMNMLLEAGPSGIGIHEVPIDTVYLDGNRSSHFRPLRDSFKIYMPIFAFSASSLLSAGIDIVLLMLLQWMTSNLLLAVVFARVGSSIFNFAMNRNYVFSRSSRARGVGKMAEVARSAPRYFTLVGVILLLNYALMHITHEQLGLPLLAAKLLTEGALFVFSFWAQRKFVY
ncbi:bifunctional glycosyltransferase family 2/GtrA family protein [Paenibacillus sp. NEAU-GSW1]|uniref:bifunctional glycosyltransferase family 2/GtrA family protein n=1 Tax=Paenibacillus sp. NEAU-GSW1 TaxID=2682486 RepID=UPI0012E2B453|nr:bifunctional glycosyltransferase family 2/GtrA family protein [Paenibacillus sp. NEAU-GSW1]MUT66502.1 glycosyltransferase [Paenibacillus sp. NEAU-GSW1]